MFGRLFPIQKNLSIQLDINNACNLSCAHCYHDNHYAKGELEFNDWLDILYQYRILLKNLKFSPQFVICGGEPTLSKNLIKLLKHISAEFRPRERTVILTNGTRLDNELLEKINPVEVRFQISLDGYDENTHDKIRGIGAFSKTMSGAENLRNYNFCFHTLTVLSRQTAGDIEKYFNLGMQIGASAVNFTRLIIEGQAKRSFGIAGNSVLKGNDLKDAVLEIANASEKNAIPTNLDQPLFSLARPGINGNGLFGFQGLVVDYKGRLKVSSRTSYVLGSLKDQSMADLFLKHELMKRLRTGQFDKCGDCFYFKNCGGNRNVAYMETGSYLGYDSGCWLSEAERRNGLV